MPLLAFAEFTLDTSNRELRRAGVLLPTEPKVLACLELLVQRAGELVTLDEMRRALWPDVRVGPDAIRQLIRAARRAVSDNGKQPKLIHTRKRLGYALLADAAPADRAPSLQRGWPFVGRQQELDVLERFVTRVRGGQGSVCLVTGEAGAGKSMLALQLRQRTCGMSFWVGHCQPGVGVPAFWPFREVAREASRDAAIGGKWEARVAADTALSQLLGPPEAVIEAAVDAEQRFLACAAFVRALLATTRDRPLLVIVEDLHWADEATLQLLELLARATRHHSLGLLTSYRAEEVQPGTPLGQLLGRLVEQAGAIELALAPLSTPELQELLCALEHPDVSLERAAALRANTGGNPLFVAQWLAQSAAHASPPVGASLQRLVSERVAKLPIETRKLLGLASVLGQDFSLSQLAVVSGLRGALLRRVLQPALVAGVVAQRAVQRGLGFTHAAVRDVLYAALSPEEKPRYHARALAAWRAAAPTPQRMSELAAHAYLSGAAVSHEVKLELCEAAAREAFVALDFERAALQFDRALELRAGDAPSEYAAHLALRRAQALWEADAPASETGRAFVRAAQLARAAGAVHVFAQAAIGCTEGAESIATLTSACWSAETVVLVVEALSALERTAASPDRTTLEHRLARALASLRTAVGDHAGAHEATSLARAREPVDAGAWTQMLSAFMHFSDAVWTAGSEGCAPLANELHEQSGRGEWRGWQRIEANLVLLSVALSRGDLAAYRDALSGVQQLLAATPTPLPFGRVGERTAIYQAVTELASVNVAILTGQLDEAERRLTQLVPDAGFALADAAAWARGGVDAIFLTWLQLLGYQGRSALLEPVVDRLLRARPEDAWQLSIAKAQILLERGALDEARKYYDVLRRTRFCAPCGGHLARAKPEMRWRMMTLCAALGDAADAAVLYESRAGGSHYFIHEGSVLSFGSASRPLGELALKLGRLDDAERLLRQALMMNERAQHRPEILCSRLALARLLPRRESQRLLAQAHAEAAELGMTALVRRRAREEIVIMHRPRLRTVLRS